MNKWWFFILCLFHIGTIEAQNIYRKEAELMGSYFDFTVVADSKEEADSHFEVVQAEISRIEQLLSEWIPDSEISQINDNAGIQPVRVSEEVIQLILRAQQFSKISNGAFDISFASINPIWKFDGSMEKIPSDESIKNSVALINYQNIDVDEVNQTIFLKKKGMKIGFGSIGKGYAADRGRKVLEDRGVTAGIVNASGDLSVWGTNPNGKPWTIGLVNPLNPQKTIGTFPLEKGAVATSGSYEKYVVLGGKKYTHIINPKTGYPVEGVASATIFAESAELANGLSTSVMVLGIEKGLFLLNQIPHIHAILIDDYGKIYTTENVTFKEITTN